MNRKGFSAHTMKGISTLIGGSIWMYYLGGYFICSNISPYIQDYFNVEVKDTQIMLPTITFITMSFMIVGTQLQKMGLDPRI